MPGSAPPGADDRRADPVRDLRRLRHRVLHSLVHAGWDWMARNGATGPGDRLADRFGAFGRGSCLAFPTGAVFGERWIRIGEDTLIGPYVSLSAGMVPGPEHGHRPGRQHR